MYALLATPCVSLLRTGGPSSIESVMSWARRAVAVPLPYTIARDCGGFALYFGTYTLVHSRLNDTASSSTDALATSDDGGTNLSVVALNVSTALVSGSAAGVTTYTWRSPLDTLYKQRMGWRPPDAPLLSGPRFVTSPRGLKAVAISGATWVVYELAVLGVQLGTKNGWLPRA